MTDNLANTSTEENEYPLCLVYERIIMSTSLAISPFGLCKEEVNNNFLPTHYNTSEEDISIQ
jgi:hypothetical protein